MGLAGSQAPDLHGCCWVVTRVLAQGQASGLLMRSGDQGAPAPGRGTRIQTLHLGSGFAASTLSWAAEARRYGCSVACPSLVAARFPFSLFRRRFPWRPEASDLDALPCPSALLQLSPSVVLPLKLPADRVALNPWFRTRRSRSGRQKRGAAPRRLLHLGLPGRVLALLRSQRRPAPPAAGRQPGPRCAGRCR